MSYVMAVHFLFDYILLTTYHVNLSLSWTRLQLNKIVNGLEDEELLLDSILMHMGSMYSKLENVELSICFYRRSLHIMERKYGMWNFDILVALMLLPNINALGLLFFLVIFVGCFHSCILSSNFPVSSMTMLDISFVWRKCCWDCYLASFFKKL